MTKIEIEGVVKDAINACADEGGWANLAKIGAFLRKQNVKYGKLSRFFKDYEYLAETRIDTTVTPPAVYARLKS
ncbi:MAG: OST-HTH/LOTUS domain-containing protein [Microscillaceae bacterium]|jgi:hypothetical protein|nr:OST-HTH/LOTUS domain-containing protein [Microscillaceae bacterium]